MTFQPSGAVNRFVFLNLPMLSLEIHLGVTVSPQIPFPTDFVTLPVSASHRRFGSLPLVAEKGHSRYNINFLPGTAFQTCSSSFTPKWAGYAGWAYYRLYPYSTPGSAALLARLEANTDKPCVQNVACLCLAPVPSPPIPCYASDAAHACD